MNLIAAALASVAVLATATQAAPISAATKDIHFRIALPQNSRCAWTPADGRELGFGAVAGNNCKDNSTLLTLRPDGRLFNGKRQLVVTKKDGMVVNTDKDVETRAFDVDFKTGKIYAKLDDGKKVALHSYGGALSTKRGDTDVHVVVA